MDNIDEESSEVIYTYNLTELSSFLKGEGRTIDEINAKLRFYYQSKNIDNLEDDEWAKLYCELLFVLKWNGTFTEKED